MAICDWPTQERPREKLLMNGPASLSDAELLAIFLRTGLPGKSALDLARDLILEFGSLKSLMDAGQKHFCSVHGLGLAKYAQLHASMELSKRYFRNEMGEVSAITSPDAGRQYVRIALKGRQHETFACLYLNTQHQIIGFEELFQGTLDAASVYPREVVKKVLEQGAAAVILCHNHPSGSEEISQSDKLITHRLTQALDLIDVRVLDHLVVAGSRVVSFAEQGLL